MVGVVVFLPDLVFELLFFVFFLFYYCLNDAVIELLLGSQR